MASLKAITIAGGGLAGLSLGIALRRHGVPVTLHEAGKYPRHRVCGEFISGVEDGVLEALGIRDIFQSARRNLNTTWFYGERKVYAADLPRPAWGISRYALDDALRLRFQEVGGELLEHSRVGNSHREGVVWCAGRIPARGPWIGLKQHVRGMELAADLEMHLGSNGYVGLARVDADTINVCGLFKHAKTAGGAGILLEYLECGGLKGLAARIKAAAADEKSRIAVTGFRLGWQSPAGHTMTLGDACGMIPPFTGNGMSMAFESALLAVSPMLSYVKGQLRWPDVAENLQASLRRKFSRRIFFANLLHPFLTDRLGQACLASAARSRLFPFNPIFHLLR